MANLIYIRHITRMEILKVTFILKNSVSYIASNKVVLCAQTHTYKHTHIQVCVHVLRAWLLLICNILLYLTAHMIHRCIKRTPISVGQIKKKSAHIKSDEISIMNIINSTFNLHNSLLNNDNRYMKITLEFNLIGIAR